MVFDHLIGLQDIGADLATPGDLFFVLAEFLQLLAFFTLLQLKEPSP
jgi:hypothetical protein